LGSQLELSAELDGQAKRHVFLDEPIRLDVVDATGAEPVADPADELLGSGGARGDPDRGCALEPRFVDLGLVIDQIGRRPGRASRLDQTVRVRRVTRSDHEQKVDLGEHLLHCPLAVRGRVADVFLAWRPDRREAAS